MEQHLHPGLRRLPQRLAKSRVRLIIGCKVQHIFHLHYEKYCGPVPLLHGAHQRMQVPYTSLRGRIGKTYMAAAFQGDTLYLHIAKPLFRFQ